MLSSSLKKQNKTITHHVIMKHNYMRLLCFNRYSLTTMAQDMPYPLKHRSGKPLCLNIHETLISPQFSTATRISSRVSYRFHKTTRLLVPCQGEFQTNSIFHMSKERCCGSTGNQTSNFMHHKWVPNQLSFLSNIYVEHLELKGEYYTATFTTSVLFSFSFNLGRVCFKAW